MEASVCLWHKMGSVDYDVMLYKYEQRRVKSIRNQLHALSRLVSIAENIF